MNDEVPTMKSALILCFAGALPSCALFAAQSSRQMVNVSYDKFEDLTEVSTNSSKVNNAIGREQKRQNLRLQVVYVCTGDTSHCRPDEVQLKFASYSVADHARSHYLILVADGKRIRAQSKWTGEYGGTRMPLEYITASIKVEDFLNFAGAVKIEGKLGETTFTLSSDNLGAIRALAGEMAPGKQTKELGYFRERQVDASDKNQDWRNRKCEIG